MGEQLEPLILAGVGVLIFVDQQIAEAVAILAEHVGMLAEDHQHVEQQVAEVAGVEGPQAVLILGVELGPAAGGVDLAFAVIDLVGRPAAVLPAVDEPGELARGPALLVEIGRGDELLDHAQLIVGIEDREIGLRARPARHGPGASWRATE